MLSAAAEAKVVKVVRSFSYDWVARMAHSGSGIKVFTPFFLHNLPFFGRIYCLSLLSFFSLKRSEFEYVTSFSSISYRSNSEYLSNKVFSNVDQQVYNIRRFPDRGLYLIHNTNSKPILACPILTFPFVT